jgi:hypothetical protein
MVTKKNIKRKLTEQRVREIAQEEIKIILAEQAIKALQFEESIDREVERLNSGKCLKNE